MDIQRRQFIHILVIFLGLVLIVGGVATGTNGAWIIGLIIAAVNFQHLQKINKGKLAGDH